MTKRSKSSKKGWKTRRWRVYEKFGVSKQAFEVWEKIPLENQNEVLRFTKQTLGFSRKAKDDVNTQQIIEDMLERRGQKIDFFIYAVSEEFGLSEHEVKTILFSPKPRKI